jgi:hypothetical protein
MDTFYQPGTYLGLGALGANAYIFYTLNDRITKLEEIVNKQQDILLKLEQLNNDLRTQLVSSENKVDAERKKVIQSIQTKYEDCYSTRIDNLEVFLKKQLRYNPEDRIAMPNMNYMKSPQRINQQQYYAGNVPQTIQHQPSSNENHEHLIS